MDDFDFDDLDLTSQDDGTDDLFGSGGTQQNDPNNGFDANGGSVDPSNMDSDFFDPNADADQLDTDTQGLSKKYIIIAVAGVLFMIIVLFIGSRLLGKKKDSNEMLNNINSQQQVTNENTNVNVDNIMNSGNNKSNQQTTPTQQDVNINYHKDENEFCRGLFSGGG